MGGWGFWGSLFEGWLGRALGRDEGWRTDVWLWENLMNMVVVGGVEKEGWLTKDFKFLIRVRRN